MIRCSNCVRFITISGAGVLTGAITVIKRTRGVITDDWRSVYFNFGLAPAVRNHIPIKIIAIYFYTTIAVKITFFVFCIPSSIRECGDSLTESCKINSLLTIISLFTNFAIRMFYSSALLSIRWISRFMTSPVLS